MRILWDSQYRAELLALSAATVVGCFVYAMIIRWLEVSHENDKLSEVGEL